MKSIISTQKVCFLCGSHRSLENHHVYGGPNRKISDKHGFTVYLCHDCHREVTEHKNWKDGYIKEWCQRVFEEDGGSRSEWMRIIGRNYLDEIPD